MLCLVFVSFFISGCGKIDGGEGPQYERSAQITDIAWGKDGSLYMRVHWVVAEHLHGDMWNTITSFPEDAVYRLDPNEKLIRMLPMEDARKIVARWPTMLDWCAKNSMVMQGEAAHGWIGGKYKVYLDLYRDTLVAFKTETRYEQTSAGSRPYQHQERRVGLGELHSRGTRLLDWDNGDSKLIPAFFFRPQSWWDAGINVSARISPDDRYIVYRDTPAQRIRIRWLSDDREVIVPDSAIPPGSKVFPTTQGLLDPQRKLLIDPETFEMREGWDLGNMQGSIGPDGQSNVTREVRTGRITVNFGTQRISSSGWIFPSEGARRSFPDWWRDLDRYPKEYSMGFEEWQ